MKTGIKMIGAFAGAAALFNVATTPVMAQSDVNAHNVLLMDNLWDVPLQYDFKKAQQEYTYMPLLPFAWQSQFEPFEEKSSDAVQKATPFKGGHAIARGLHFIPETDPDAIGIPKPNPRAKINGKVKTSRVTGSKFKIDLEQSFSRIRVGECRYPTEITDYFQKLGGDDPATMKKVRGLVSWAAVQLFGDGFTKGKMPTSQLQFELSRNGCYETIKRHHDGNYGPSTERALIAFQKKMGLKPTARKDKENFAKTQQYLSFYSTMHMIYSGQLIKAYAGSYHSAMMKVLFHESSDGKNGWNPYAVSATGATGVGQFISTTYRGTVKGKYQNGQAQLSGLRNGKISYQTFKKDATDLHAGIYISVNYFTDIMRRYRTTNAYEAYLIYNVGAKNYYKTKRANGRQLKYVVGRAARVNGLGHATGLVSAIKTVQKKLNRNADRVQVITSVIRELDQLGHAPQPKTLREMKQSMGIPVRAMTADGHPYRQGI